ncbi:hypothetical protein [Arthrobacter sp. P2b]|nr:hypothetical protein [Arthrobacter sp. P2b]
MDGVALDGEVGERGGGDLAVEGAVVDPRSRGDRIAAAFRPPIFDKG